MLQRPNRRAAVIALPFLGGTVGAPARAAGRTITVGAGERVRTLADASRLAQPGDVIELQPGDYRADVAVFEQRPITVRGLGSGALLHADGRHAEGKAIVVTRGDVTMENIEFRGCRVPSGNGAGIRFERGRLMLKRCRFFDNEMGLLSASEVDMALDIVDCTFGLAPRHAGLLHHLLYVGAIGRFQVQGSRFEQGWRGHLLKSRALVNVVRGNWLVDGPLGEASYELEFPSGGDNTVEGNVIAQSAGTQNPTVVSMGAEAHPGLTGRLRFVHNTVVNHASGAAHFVQVWGDRLPADTPVWMENNLLAGPGRLNLPANAQERGNVHVALSALRDAGRGDYRLAAPVRSQAAPSGGPPWPGALPHALPGALQTPG